MVHKTKKEIIFVLALLFYFAVHIWVATEVHVQRNIPWEPDDHYHYVIKAANLINTRIGPTPGLDDIYEQTEISNQSDELKKRKIRERHHFLQSYHPLYTIILVAIKYLGFTYENAQTALEIIGAIIIGIGFAFFSVTVFGKGPSTILMLIFSVLYFRGWGLHYTSPFTLASACTLISLGFLAYKSNRYLIYSFISLTAAVAFHPSGIILTALILLATVLLYRGKLNVKLSIFLLLSIVVSLFFYKFHFRFVDHEISLLGTYKHDNIFIAFTSNVKGLIYSINKNISDAVPYGYKWIFLLLLGCAILSRRLRRYLTKHILNWHHIFPKKQLYVIKIYAISLAFLLIGSLFSLVSLHIFDRIYLVYYTFIVGFVCAISWPIFNEIYSPIQKIIVDFYINKQLTFKINRQDWQKILFSVGLTILFIFFMIFSLKEVYKGAAGKLVAHNLTFNREQVTRLLSISDENDRILYNMGTNDNGMVKGVESFVYNSNNNNLNTEAEAATYFYFSYGASKRGAVLSSLLDPNTIDKWINNKVRYMVTLSPTTVLFSGDLFLTEKDSLNIISSSGSEDIKTISFYIENKNPRHKVKFKLSTTVKDYEIIIPSGAGWYTFNLEGNAFTKRKLSASVWRVPLFSRDNLFNQLKSFWRLKYLNRRIRISGIRINSQDTFWPWDSKYQIELYKNQWGKKRKMYKLPFNTSMLSPVKNLYVDRIIDDQGSIILTSLKWSGN